MSGRARPTRSTTRPLRPAPTIGIIGGGQLAKMTAQAAATFGCEVVVLERQREFPADALDTHTLLGDWDDPACLLQLAALTDVVTLENEFVGADALEALEVHGHELWPRAATVRVVQDKLHQKQRLAQAGLGVPRFAPAPTREAAAAHGVPAVLKARRYGYDGRGNASLRTPTDLARAWQRLDGDRNPLLVEDFCPFTRELAVIVTRGRDGQTVTYPVVESVNRDHICHIVKAPADASPALAAEAAALARRAVEAVDGVGTFGVEMFVTADDRVLVNELAPRVHNTGHYTIEACESSQFENHVRAVLGWPLGSPRMVVPAAVMVNLLGVGPGSGTPRGLTEALRVPGAHVHVYGKTRAERGRKMGHVTALGATLDEALATARRAADVLRFGD